MTAQPAVIDGKRVLGETAAHVLDVLDPATGNLLDQTVRGGADEIDAAVAAAHRAATVGPALRMPPDRRCCAGSPS